MSITIAQISDTEYVVNTTHVTVWRDGDGAVRTNPVLEPAELKKLREFITIVYKKNSPSQKSGYPFATKAGELD